jgi:hypothetical protein
VHGAKRTALRLLGPSHGPGGAIDSLIVLAKTASSPSAVLLQRWRPMKGESGSDPDQVTLRGDIKQAGDEAGLASDVASADVPKLPCLSCACAFIPIEMNGSVANFCLAAV